MKRTILALFILIAIWPSGEAQVSFQEKMAITEMVAKWTSAQHITTIDQLNSLYAPTVLINGEYKTREACIKEKSYLVNQYAGIHQEIITPVEITFYESGTIKCSFIKRVRYKQELTDYRSYLLLQKVGDQYQITGEGGQVSEQSLKAGIKLGEEVSPPGSASESSWAIFCAASLLLMVIVIWMMGKSAMVAHNFVHPKTNINAALNTDDKTIKSSGDPKAVNKVAAMHIAQSAPLDEEDNGRVFEEFILNKFPKDKFNLIEWKSDKEDHSHLRQGFGSQRNTDDRKKNMPDLQLELKLESEKYPFAVECKWRNDFWKGIIEWARDAQISSYQEFQVSKDIPVFIALGVGGTPSDPRDLFIIPLSHLYKSILTEDWLKKYKRESRDNFFLNLNPMLLK